MLRKEQEAVCEGWLIKSPLKRIWRTRWKRRWFVLRQSGELPGQFLLEYYSGQNCRNPKGVINLDQCEQVDAGLKFEERNIKYCNLFNIKTPERVFYLAAESEQDMNKWVDCICHVCGLKVYLNEDYIGKNQTKNESKDKPVAISGPYIPISECITGPLPLTPQELKYLNIRKIHERSESLSIFNNDIVTKPVHVRTSSAIELTSDPKIYDSPRQLKPEKSNPNNFYTNSLLMDDILNKRSPIVLSAEVPDTENVFNFNVITQSERNYRKIVNNNTSDVSTNQNNNHLELGPVTLPRYPKVDQICHNYSNLDLNKNIDEEKTEVDDETYDCPRSHLLPKLKSTNIFQYPLESDLPSPKSISSNSLSQLNSILPTSFSEAEIQVETPPSVNRKLKPTNKPPNIDRKLKPQIIYQVDNSNIGIKALQKNRATSSHIALSKKAMNHGVINFNDQLDKFQYLDLDLSTDHKIPVTKSNLTLSKSTVVYKTVDFVKTEAFKLTKQRVEANRGLLFFRS